MTEQLRQSIADFVAILIAALVILYVQDANSRQKPVTPEQKAELREMRHKAEAYQVTYASCMQACSEGCAKEPK